MAIYVSTFLKVGILVRLMYRTFDKGGYFFSPGSYFDIEIYLLKKIINDQTRIIFIQGGIMMFEQWNVQCIIQDVVYSVFPTSHTFNI